MAKVKKKQKLKIMVASTVYHFEDQLNVICGVLKGFGYDVRNSHIRTIPVHPGKSNLENSLAAVRDCDLFFGIIRPFYGSGIVGARSITHEEFREALRLNRPRWILAHRDVTFARQLLKRYMFKRNGDRTKFKLKDNPVMDDLRVIDLYNDAILNNVTIVNRTGNWVPEYYRIEEVLDYLDKQLQDKKRVRRICQEMKKKTKTKKKP